MAAATNGPDTRTDPAPAPAPAPAPVRRFRTSVTSIAQGGQVYRAAKGVITIPLAALDAWIVDLVDQGVLTEAGASDGD